MKTFLQLAVVSLVSFVRAPLPSSFGVAGIRRQRISGAILIVGDWDAQRGVETDEAGMNIASFIVRYFPFVNERLLSNVGEPRARAQSDKLSREIKLKGEFIGSGPAFAVATACVVANDIADFGDGSGDPLFDEATVTQERAGWKEVEASLSSDPGVTVAP